MGAHIADLPEVSLRQSDAPRDRVPRLLADEGILDLRRWDCADTSIRRRPCRSRSGMALFHVQRVSPAAPAPAGSDAPRQDRAARAEAKLSRDPADHRQEIMRLLGFSDGGATSNHDSPPISPPEEVLRAIQMTDDDVRSTSSLIRGRAGAAAMQIARAVGHQGQVTVFRPALCDVVTARCVWRPMKS